MSIKIKKLTGETFDLPSDYVIEATRTSPMFSNKGPQTVPISFPATDANRRLTEQAARLDVAARPSTMDVIIESGSMQQTGLLSINTASHKTISASIGWNESEMYASMNKTLLSDLPDLPVFDPGGSDLDQRRDAMLTHLYDVMNELTTYDYAIFPLILKKDTTDDEQIYLEILNETFSSTTEEFGAPTPSGGIIGGFCAKENRIIQRVYNGKATPFDVPKCYGLSPFLRVWKLLELIFLNYGFTLENNPFYEHTQLRRLVVLNNTMDAVITGRLYYKDLMPYITVEEFLDSLKKKFGMLYFVNSNNRTIHIEFLNNIFDPSNHDMIDLTPYKTEAPAITYKENKQLKLVPNNEIEETAPKYDTYEEFLAAFNNSFYDIHYEDRYQFISLQYSLYFLTWLRFYYWSGSVIESAINMLSSDFFGWDKKDDLNYEEIKFTDLSLPFYFVLSEWALLPQGTRLLMYLVNYKNNYSDESVDEKKVEKEQAKAKLAFAFAWGKGGKIIGPLSEDYDYAYASQDNRGFNGHFIINQATGNPYDISLYTQHEDGLFNRFWRHYDAWLRHSGHEVNTTVKMTELELSSVTPWRKIMIDNQLFILEELRYRIGDPAAKVELKLRTMRTYEPCDLEAEQALPTYSAQLYYWRPESVFDPDPHPTITHLESSGIPYTLHKINSSVEFTLPPTQQQYDSNETIVMTNQIQVRWFENGIDQDNILTQITTYYPTQIP